MTIVSNYCQVEPFVLFLQRGQLQKAKLELFGTTDVGFKGDDLLFYSHYFDWNTLSIANESHWFDSLIYYRIYKNANDNIRSLLFNYQLARWNNISSPTFYPCIEEDCILPNANTIKNLSTSRRFPFTYVRDPLTRAISAINEVILAGTLFKWKFELRYILFETKVEYRGGNNSFISYRPSERFHSTRFTTS